MNNEELKELLNECILEQQALGLKTPSKVLIYFNRDPYTHCYCRYTLGKALVNDNVEETIIIKKDYFDIVPLTQKKELLHHELIHTIKNDKGQYISHRRNWKEFADISNLINETYHYNPLSGYSYQCFDKDGQIHYLYYAICPRCGEITHFKFQKYKNIDDISIKCHNCGKKKILYKVEEDTFLDKLKKNIISLLHKENYGE